jgi:MFS family permease
LNSSRKTGRKKRLPVMEALVQHPGAFLKIIALRLCELLTMYIVTAFALNYSTQNLGLPRELFLNIGLLVGGISCLTIPCFAWLADRFGRRRVYHRGADWHPQRLAILYGAGGAVDLLDCLLRHHARQHRSRHGGAQQPMFTELFGASYRYSGAGVGYQVASVVGGGFTPFIAAALVTFSGGNWHSVAIYLLAGCLLSAATALLMKETSHPDLLLFHRRVTYYRVVAHLWNKETEMNNKGSSLTPAQALEKLDALYEQSVNALRSAISEYIETGNFPTKRPTEGLFVYPSLSVTWDGSASKSQNPRLRALYPLRLLQHHRHPPCAVPPLS